MPTVDPGRVAGEMVIVGATGVTGVTGVTGGGGGGGGGAPEASFNNCKPETATPPVVTNTSRKSVAAVAETVMLALTWVASLKVVEFTVIPVPEKDTTLVAVNDVLLPVIATFAVVPTVTLVGAIPVIDGTAALTMAVVRNTRAAVVPSTVTSLYAAGAVGEMVMLAVRSVAELAVTVLTVIPVALNVTLDVFVKVVFKP